LIYGHGYFITHDSQPAGWPAWSQHLTATSTLMHGCLV